MAMLAINSSSLAMTKQDLQDTRRINRY